MTFKKSGCLLCLLLCSGSAGQHRPKWHWVALADLSMFVCGCTTAVVFVNVFGSALSCVSVSFLRVSPLLTINILSPSTIDQAFSETLCPQQRHSYCLFPAPHHCCMCWFRRSRGVTCLLRCLTVLICLLCRNMLCLGPTKSWTDRHVLYFTVSLYAKYCLK